MNSYDDSSSADSGAGIVDRTQESLQTQIVEFCAGVGVPLEESKAEMSGEAAMTNLSYEDYVWRFLNPSSDDLES